MTAGRIETDERTLVVQNASYRWAYFLLAYGLLASIAWRAFARKEASWDLFALVIGSGVVTTAFQGRGQVLGRRWAMLSAAALVAALVLAAMIALSRR